MIGSPYLISLTIANANVPPELIVGLKGVGTRCLDQIELSNVSNKDVPKVSSPTAKTQTPLADGHHIDRPSIEHMVST